MPTRRRLSLLALCGLLFACPQSDPAMSGDEGGVFASNPDAAGAPIDQGGAPSEVVGSADHAGIDTPPLHNDDPGVAPSVDGHAGGDGETQTSPPPTGGWCSPRPHSLMTTVARDVVSWIQRAERGTCPLVAMDREDDGAVEATPLHPPEADWCDHPCVKSGRSFAWAWTEPGRPGLRGPEVWSGVIRSWPTPEGMRVVIDAQVEGSSAQRLIERRYRGRQLEWERFSFGGSLWYETEDRYSPDGLVRTTHTDHVNGGQRGPVVVDTLWRHHEGRLIDASMSRRWPDLGPTGPIERYEAIFRYDERGRVVRVERQIDDVVWLEQAWSYGAEDALISRQVALGGVDRRPPAPTDDLVPSSVHGDFFVDPWQDSLPRDVGDCRRLPASILHGYPEGEGVYLLGWPAADRPSGMGFDYAYNGYAYDYGERAWFGHGGVAGGEAPMHMGGALEVTIDYDEQGRMVEERADASDDRGAWSATRRRTFDHQGIMADDAMLTVGDETQRTSLAFEWGYGGVLSHRRYRVEGALAALHRWRYEYRAVEHIIENHPGIQGYGDPNFRWMEAPAPSLEGHPAQAVVHRRERTPDELEETWLEWAIDGDDASEPETTLWRRFDDQGRVVAQDQGFRLIEWTFDADGVPLVEEVHDADGGLVRERRLVRGDQGLLQERSVRFGDGTVDLTQRYRYDCAP